MTPFKGYQPKKLTHLHFYFHDFISVDKLIAIRVTMPPRHKLLGRLIICLQTTTMAKRFQFILPLFSIILLLGITAAQFGFYSKMTPFKGYQPKKLTHLHFYFHDYISVDKLIAIRVTMPRVTNSSTVSSFGMVVIADLLTKGPDPTSKEIRRAQGMYVSTDMNTLSFTMVFNLVFTEGEFNGSTVCKCSEFRVIKFGKRRRHKFLFSNSLEQKCFYTNIFYYKNLLGYSNPKLKLTLESRLDLSGSRNPELNSL
ncbi:hypothetical protein F2Q68_00013966 [Brassica cretica]|uniref:Dirigent protein n=1 Tax=Brassica cretica TaxID=69181 RepID=A0A8S9HG73_BRACR|nr:hypothetical protein F2Q68_00013966 [Brassica cretica]